MEGKKKEKRGRKEVEMVMHIDGKEGGERRMDFGFCKGGEEMAVHIQSHPQRVQPASHQSVLGDS